MPESSENGRADLPARSPPKACRDKRVRNVVDALGNAKLDLEKLATIFACELLPRWLALAPIVLACDKSPKMMIA